MNEINFSVLANNIEKLSAEKGLSKTKALTESGVGKDFIVNMINKNQVPSVIKIYQLAQYFGVSIDYLLGYTPKSEHDARTEKLINFASKLSEQQIDALIEMCSKLLDT